MGKFLNTLSGMLLGLVGLTAHSDLSVSLRATHYSQRLEGKPMANGKPYRASAFTAACNLYPLGTLLKVYNPVSGIGMYARVTDRTAKTKHGLPGIDLSDKVFDGLKLSRRKGWGLIRVEAVEEAYPDMVFGVGGDDRFDNTPNV